MNMFSFLVCSKKRLEVLREHIRRVMQVPLLETPCMLEDALSHVVADNRQAVLAEKAF